MKVISGPQQMPFDRMFLGKHVTCVFCRTVIEIELDDRQQMGVSPCTSTPGWMLNWACVSCLCENHTHDHLAVDPNAPNVPAPPFSKNNSIASQLAALQPPGGLGSSPQIQQGLMGVLPTQWNQPLAGNSLYESQTLKNAFSEIMSEAEDELRVAISQRQEEYAKAKILRSAIGNLVVP